MSATANLSATFNDFLFATVCEERNEMPLSVISALARLDLDPWTEAAELARMPADGAAGRLSSLLARVINDPPTPLDRATIAARLVALLPTLASVASREPSARTLTVPQSSALRIMWLACLASMAGSVLLASLAPHAPDPASGPIPVISAHR